MINFKFTKENAIALLKKALSKSDKEYSHNEIFKWCDSFWCNHLDDDPIFEIELILPILADVDCQWDLYLANEFGDKLGSIDIEEIEIPEDYLIDWIFQLENSFNILRVDETEIIGKWNYDKPEIEEDQNCARIKYLIESYLEFVESTNGGWEKVYIDKKTGKKWILSHPMGHLHGGGPPALKRID